MNTITRRCRRIVPLSLFLLLAASSLSVADWSPPPDARSGDNPGLFHLFMPSTTPGTGLGTPSDYGHADHVVEQAIVDIATWIASLPEARK